MNVITMSAIAVTLFLGGPSGPRIGFLSTGFLNTWVMPIFWFLVKVLALLFATVWLRASLPRMRYDKLMALGWKYLIEIAILWVLVTAALQVGDDQGWNLVVDRRHRRRRSRSAAYGVLYARDAEAGRADRGDSADGRGSPVSSSRCGRWASRASRRSTRR